MNLIAAIREDGSWVGIGAGGWCAVVAAGIKRMRVEAAMDLGGAWVEEGRRVVIAMDLGGSRRWAILVDLGDVRGGDGKGGGEDGEGTWRGRHGCQSRSIRCELDRGR